MSVWSGSDVCPATRCGFHPPQAPMEVKGSDPIRLPAHEALSGDLVYPVFSTVCPKAPFRPLTSADFFALRQIYVWVLNGRRKLVDVGRSLWRDQASTIASASAASFFWRFTNGFT